MPGREREFEVDKKVRADSLVTTVLPFALSVNGFAVRQHRTSGQTVWASFRTERGCRAAWRRARAEGLEGVKMHSRKDLHVSRRPH